MAPARPLASSPWTVVLQGSDHLSYEEATQLDKLEYALGVGTSSVDKFLGQDGVIGALSSALAKATTPDLNADAYTRAGKLLTAIVDYVTPKSRSAAFNQFLSGLGPTYLQNFINLLEKDKEVASWYLGALGPILGSRALTNAAEQNGDEKAIEEQKRAYSSAAADVLATITAQSLLANEEEEEEQAEEQSTSAALPAVSFSSLRSSGPHSAASSIGYIPTVADIGAPLPQPFSSAGDEQLGRILSGIAQFLSTDENRLIFCTVKPDCGRGPALLASLLDKEVGMPVQVHYQAVFCLWLLSFVSQQDSSCAAVEVVSDALEEAAVPRRLTLLLREVWAEKVVRVSLATLRNLLGMSTTLRKEMVGAGLVSALQSLCFRRWNDEDIRDDLGVLAEALESELASMSNFDVYRAEVLSGGLEWTPAHRDDTFWEENAEKLERNNQEVLRCLVRLLHQSTDETVLAVACNDLAQFMKHNQRGRIIMQSLGVKGRLMELMVTGEGEARRYALNCVQVLMIRWNRQES